MNRVLLAFLGGALFATGLVYVGVTGEIGQPRSVAADSWQTAERVKPAPEPLVISSAAPLKRSPLTTSNPVVAVENVPVPVVAKSLNVDGGSSPKPRVEHTHLEAVAQKEVPDSPLPQIAAPEVPQPANREVEPPQPEPAPVDAPAVQQPRSVTVPAGTLIPVRMAETLTTARNQANDLFTATLDQPLVVDGLIIAERGARAFGRILETDPGNRVASIPHLTVELTGFHSSDGQDVRVRTASFVKQASAIRANDASKIGGSAAFGAVVGGAAGGAKGAGIGAVAGGALGIADVLATRKAADLPVETRISFRVDQPVTITERVR